MYKKTMIKENFIRTRGYNLVVMWEHDWKNYKKDPDIVQFTNKELEEIDLLD